MKPYLVAEYDLPLAPLNRNEHNPPRPPRGMNLWNCDNLAEARSYALQAMPSRDLACIYRRRINGRPVRIEHYQKLSDSPCRIQRYVQDRRDRHFLSPVTCRG